MRRFAHRLAVSAGAGATLFGATAGVWWLRRGEAGRHGSEIVGIAAGSGAAVGAGYALARPLLPARPETAGLTYSLALGFAIRAQLNALAKAVGRPRRFHLTARRFVDEVTLGVLLAQAERWLGPRS